MNALRLAGVCAVLIACASSKPVPEPASKAVTVEQPAPAPVATPPATPAAPVQAAEPVKPVQPVEALAASIYFEFDKSDLVATSRARLAHVFDAANAPGAKVRIEGNCDERGTSEYNLALGQRRADSAKKYLVNLGVPADRIQTISYGEEKPKMTGHDEESWKENRRDDIFIEAAPAVSLR